MYKIEHGIPIPDWPPGHKPISPIFGSKIYPFQEMKVGDSFLVPPKPGETIHAVAVRIRPRAHRESVGGKKFISRKCKDGVRVWRVE